MLPTWCHPKATNRAQPHTPHRAGLAGGPTPCEKTRTGLACCCAPGAVEWHPVGRSPHGVHTCAPGAAMPGAAARCANVCTPGTVGFIRVLSCWPWHGTRWPGMAPPDPHPNGPGTPGGSGAQAVPHPHDGLPAGVHSPRYGCNRFTRCQPLANVLELRTTES